MDWLGRCKGAVGIISTSLREGLGSCLLTGGHALFNKESMRLGPGVSVAVSRTVSEGCDTCMTDSDMHAHLSRCRNRQRTVRGCLGAMTHDRTRHTSSRWLACDGLHDLARHRMRRRQHGWAVRDIYLSLDMSFADNPGLNILPAIGHQLSRTRVDKSGARLRTTHST